MSIVAQQSHQVSSRVRPNPFNRDNFLVKLILVKLQPALEIQFATGDALRQFQQIAAAISSSDLLHQKPLSSLSKLAGRWKIGMFFVKARSYLVHKVSHHAFRCTPSA